MPTKHVKVGVSGQVKCLDGSCQLSQCVFYINLEVWPKIAACGWWQFLELTTSFLHCSYVCHVPSTLRPRGDWLFTQTRRAPVFKTSSRFPFPLVLTIRVTCHQSLGTPQSRYPQGFWRFCNYLINCEIMAIWNTDQISDQKLFWELKAPLAPCLWGAVLLPSSAPSQVASGIIGLRCFQTAKSSDPELHGARRKKALLLTTLGLNWVLWDWVVMLPMVMEREAVMEGITSSLQCPVMNHNPVWKLISVC